MVKRILHLLFKKTCEITLLFFKKSYGYYIKTDVKNTRR